MLRASDSVFDSDRRVSDGYPPFFMAMLKRAARFYTTEVMHVPRAHMPSSLQFLGDSRGSVLLTTIVIFFVFLVLMISGVSYINRQYKEATNTEEKQKSFYLADSGVTHILYGLNHDFYTMSGLLSGQPITETVTDPASGQAVGTFTTSFTAGGGTPASEFMQLVSKGRAASGNQCETVTATLQRLSNSSFTLKAWQHQLGCP